MALVLTLFALSFLLIVANAFVLSAALRPEAEPPATEKRQPAETPRFFKADMIHPRTAAASPVPVEVLLRQVEQHIRLEQAAAESFHLCPTPESLHMQTGSPLMH